MHRDWRQRRRRIGGAIAITVVALAGGAAGADAKEIIAVYSAYWAGLPAAKIRLTLRDGNHGYRDEIDIETQGLVHLFTRFRATASAEGRHAPNQMAEPSRYLAVYDLRKRHDRRISMEFLSRTGRLIAERNTDDTSRKPQLGEAFRRHAVDPLSALERIREALRAAGPGGSFAVPVYDGARRFDVLGKVMPEGHPADGVVKAELTLRPIAGFKGETSEDGDPDDAPRKAELAMTDDLRMLPLSVSVPVFFMPLVIQFERLCSPSDPCSR